MRPLRLVLPCYNEAKNLPEIVDRAVACARRRGLTTAEFRLFLVENGSKDESLAVMQTLQKQPGGEFFEIVPIAVNEGYGHGVFTGLKAAAAAGKDSILAWSHADQQCDPEDAFRGWELIGEQPPGELVKGRRHGRALAERVISRGFELTTVLMLGHHLTEINAQPKVFHASLLDRLTDRSGPPKDFTFDVYVLFHAMLAGWHIREIDVHFPPRKHGLSNWSSTLRSRTRTIAKFVAYLARLRKQYIHGGATNA